MPKPRPRQSRRLWWSLLMAACLSCSGCATGDFEPAVNACALLPLRDYPAAEQRQVADEIEAAPASAVWPGWISDYGVLRAAVRACRGGR